MAKDDGNGFRRTKLRNDEKTEDSDKDSDGFFSGTDCDPSRSSLVGEGAKGVVWSALDISRMKPGLERTVGCPVYWSSIRRKDTCSLVGLSTGEMGRDGNGELKVDYIPLQNNVACTFPQPSGHMYEIPARLLPGLCALPVTFPTLEE